MNLTKSDRINKALNQVGIHSFKDVIFHLPRRYDDLHPTHENNLLDKERVVLVGHIVGAPLTRRFSSMSVTKFTFVSEKKNVFYVEAWNRPYLSKNLNDSNELYTLIGYYDLKKNKINLLSINKGQVVDGNYLKPIYSLPKGIDNFEFIRLVDKAFTLIGPNDLWNEIPTYYIKKYRLLSKYEALYFAHKPKNDDDIYKGLRVLKYEECLLFSLKTQIIRNQNKESINYKKTLIDLEKIHSFIATLDYQLTNDQKQAVEEMLNDMNKPNLMYRLLQGDVGTGKTLVAEILLYANYLRGDQGALMAPTDALAKQHYRNLRSLFTPLGIKVCLLTGSMNVTQRSAVRRTLINKEVDIVVGTHILFSKDINYLSLGLAVIDEQHKFGVNQRMHLASKGDHADLLLMSATPIPRTLALTLYGDLDVSTLEEFPHRERKIKTQIIRSNSEILYNRINESLSQNKRVFIVAPSIIEEDNKKTSVETLYARYLLKFPGKVGLLHGKLEQDDKDFALKDFESGKTPILISTTVIEVGIDVSNADLMVIYDASSFGLASLHQLRGRIGRDGSKATCLLLYDGDDKEELDKLNVMVKSNNGFFIAEEDLKRRGPGELGGVRQSGIANFTFVNLVKDFRMFEAARGDAKFIIANSNQPGFAHILKRANKEIDDDKFTNS